MCDYSLEHVASREAKIGDELITTRFGEAFTRGFCAVGDPNMAVCLLPGTEIVFAGKAERRSLLGNLFAWVFPGIRFGNPRGEVACFRRINLHNPQTYHDALEFADGTTVPLTLLRPGQGATVLQLPARQHSLRKDAMRGRHLRAEA